MKFLFFLAIFYLSVLRVFSQTTAPTNNLLLANNPQKTLYFSNKGYTDASKVIDSLSILRGVKIILCVGTDIGIFKTYPLEKVPAGQKMLTYYKNINWKERRSDSTDVFLTKMHQNLKKESKEYADSAQWNNYLVINLSCLQYLYAGRDDNNEIETKWTHNTKSSTLGSVYVKSWGDLTLTDLKANNDKALLAWLKRLPLSVSWLNALPFKAILDNTTQQGIKTLILVKATTIQKQIAQRKCKIFHYAGHGTNLQIQREIQNFNYQTPFMYKYLDTEAEIAQFITDNPGVAEASILAGAKKESQEVNYGGNYIVSSDAGQYAGASVQVPLAEIDTWELLPEVREYVWLHQYSPFYYEDNKQTLDDAPTPEAKRALLEQIASHFRTREPILNTIRTPGTMVLSRPNLPFLVIIDDLAQRNAKQQITISGDKGVLTW